MRSVTLLSRFLRGFPPTLEYRGWAMVGREELNLVLARNRPKIPPPPAHPPLQTFSTLRSHFPIIGILTVLYLLLYTTFLFLKSAEYIHRAMGNFELGEIISCNLGRFKMHF